MEITYKIIAAVGLVFNLTSCNENVSSAANKSAEPKPKDSPQVRNTNPENNPYEGLRNLALSATPEQIGVQYAAGKTKIYGVIMDWDLGDGTATLVAFSTGDASLYLSSGGGVIGGNGHDSVKQAASAFINKAGQYLDMAVKSDSTPLPGKDGVKFYFLTTGGKFVGQEEMKNFENNSSPWMELFEAGNKLITEIRKAGGN